MQSESWNTVLHIIAVKSLGLRVQIFERRGETDKMEQAFLYKVILPRGRLKGLECLLEPERVRNEVHLI